jgi:hypothetical protein
MKTEQIKAELASRPRHDRCCELWLALWGESWNHYHPTPREAYLRSQYSALEWLSRNTDRRVLLKQIIDYLESGRRARNHVEMRVDRIMAAITMHKLTGEF